MRNLKTLLFVVAMLPVFAAAQGVDHRQHEQHKRIVQGIHHGSLTKKEAAAIRAREAIIRAREHRDRLAHRGHLTIAERRRLEHSQRKVSHEIYRQKHDRQHRP